MNCASRCSAIRGSILSAKIHTRARVGISTSIVNLGALLEATPVAGQQGKEQCGQDQGSTNVDEKKRQMWGLLSGRKPGLTAQ